ncbi:MAG: ribosome assembly factor SBDS [Candidatus Anstonellales archaeon]
MSSLENSVIASLEKNGQKFQILVDAKKIYDYLDGTLKVPVQTLLVSYDIYKDVHKVEKHSDETLKKVFHTTDYAEIAQIIIKEGEVQLTTEQRRKMVEQKRLKIINLIAQMAVDAQTNLPIPITRIELAMEKIKFNIDPFKPAEAQVDEVLSKLRLHLPIKTEKINFVVKIPQEYAYKVYGFLKEFQPEKIEHDNQGNLYAKFSMYAKLKSDFLEKLANRTAGNLEYKEL